MTRTFARRFNNLYGMDVFPEPTAFNFGNELVKIPGLDGSGKMGKSEGNGIFFVDDEKTVTRKVMHALTDSGPTAPDSPMPEPIQNIFTLLEVVSTPDTVAFFREKYNDCTIRYGDLKKQLAADIWKKIAPIHERIAEIKADKAYLRKVTQNGAAKARESAQATLKEVKKAIGFRAF
jgi:tryptophanyl-tRNA synthetase